MEAECAWVGHSSDGVLFSVSRSEVAVSMLKNKGSAQSSVNSCSPSRGPLLATDGVRPLKTTSVSSQTPDLFWRVVPNPKAQGLGSRQMVVLPIVEKLNLARLLLLALLLGWKDVQSAAHGYLVHLFPILLKPVVSCCRRGGRFDLGRRLAQFRLWRRCSF